MTDLSQSEDTIEEVTTSSEVTEEASDKLTPDHPRFKQVLTEKKEAETKLEERERELEEVKRLLEERSTLRTENIDYTQEELAAMSKIERGLRDRGFITKEDAEKSQSETNRTLTLTRLSDKFDGKNGLPKFDPVDVTVYAKRNGYGDNLEQAYKAMHFDTLVSLEAKRQSTNPPSSERPTGGQLQQTVEITPDQIKKMTPSEYSKHREKILATMRASV